MKRLLVCGGLFGHEKGLQRLARAVDSYRPDGLVFVGGVLPRGRSYTPRTTAWGMTREDAQAVHRFFEAVGRLGVFSAVIPGPLDTPLEEFVRMGMHAELDQPKLRVVHLTPAEHDDMIVVGLGGQLCDGPACEPDSISRTMAEYGLRRLPEARQTRKVLLLSEPLGGTSRGGHPHDLCGDLIRSLHPSLCAVAGPTATAGGERWGRTLVVNPGWLADGSAALVDWSRPALEQVEVLDLRNHVTIGARDTGGSD